VYNGKEGSSEFYQQYLEVEETKKMLSDNAEFSKCYKTHPSAIHTSRLLNFKNLNLPKPQNSEEINKQFYQTKQFDLELRLVEERLENLEIIEEHQSQIQIPPK
jgi:hypothetical protein